MDENDSTCAKCEQDIKQFDPDGGLWVGDLESGGKYDCPNGGLHRPERQSGLPHRASERWRSLTAPQKQLLDDTRALELMDERSGDASPGALVSGARYRTALALERKGLGHVRYQGPSLGWFTLPKSEERGRG
jgi:hypothetical protein